MLFKHERWKPFFFPINLKKPTSISLYDTRVQLCRTRVLRLFGQRAAAWERGYEQESQTFFSLLISDSSLELSSTVPTGYFFLSISRTDLWSQGKDDNTNTLQRRCKIWFSDVPDVITMFQWRRRKKIENTEQYSGTAQLPRNTQNFRTKQLSTAASIRCQCKVIILIYTYHQSWVYMLRIYKNPTFSRVLQGKKAHNGI